MVVGEEVCITWTSTSMTNRVDVLYSTDLGASWTLIGEAPNIGVYPWDVPEDAVSDDVLVAIVSVYDPAVVGASPEPNRVVPLQNTELDLEVTTQIPEPNPVLPLQNPESNLEVTTQKPRPRPTPVVPLQNPELNLEATTQDPEPNPVFPLQNKPLLHSNISIYLLHNVADNTTLPELPTFPGQQLNEKMNSSATANTEELISAPHSRRLLLWLLCLPLALVLLACSLTSLIRKPDSGLKHICTNTTAEGTEAMISAI